MLSTPRTGERQVPAKRLAPQVQLPQTTTVFLGVGTSGKPVTMRICCDYGQVANNLWYWVDSLEN
jgi:hypothetical protein